MTWFFNHTFYANVLCCFNDYNTFKLIDLSLPHNYFPVTILMVINFY